MTGESVALGSVAPFPETLEPWLRALNADRELRLRSRCARFAVSLACRDQILRFTVTPEAGVQASDTIAAEITERLDFVGGPEAWARFLSPVPPRFHTDVIGMARRVDEFEIRSDLGALRRHLHIVHRFFEVIREARDGDR